jgi:hypothetical protein
MGNGTAISITGSSVIYSGGNSADIYGRGGSANSNGSAGLVIVRYSDAYPPASATTGSPTITVTGGFRIYTWTGSGSITI